MYDRLVGYRRSVIGKVIENQLAQEVKTKSENLISYISWWCLAESRVPASGVF